MSVRKSVGLESYAIHHSTKLPKVFSPRARMRVAALIVIFAAFAVPGVRTSERDQSSDIDLGTDSLIRAQNCVARSRLEP